MIKPQHYFYTIDGRVLKDKREMINYLKDMDIEHFHHHVNSTKNDFATWTKEVLNDEKLAKKMTHTKDKDEMISILEENLKLKSVHKKDRKSVISQLIGAIKNG